MLWGAHYILYKKIGGQWVAQDNVRHEMPCYVAEHRNENMKDAVYVMEGDTLEETLNEQK